jgi:hypothetical protein
MEDRGKCYNSAHLTKSLLPTSLLHLEVESGNELLESRELRRALADLRQAIRSPSDTGFYCYRAVESLRHAFVRETDKDDTEPSWIALKQALNYDRSFIEKIEFYGGNQRHGKEMWMPWIDREICLRNAWEIVDRFCIYLKTGKKALDPKVYLKLT